MGLMIGSVKKLKFACDGDDNSLKKIPFTGYSGLLCPGGMFCVVPPSKEIAKARC